MNGFNGLTSFALACHALRSSFAHVFVQAFQQRDLIAQPLELREASFIPSLARVGVAQRPTDGSQPLQRGLSFVEVGDADIQINNLQCGFHSALLPLERVCVTLTELR